MYIARIPFATPEYDESVYLRDLLLRKPIGKSLNIIGVRHEYKQTSLGAYDMLDHLLGVVMLKPKSGTTVRLRQMVVDEESQGRGIGRALVQAALDRAQQMGYERIICHARKDVVGFYEKFGFSVSGEPFEELGIEHLEMERDIQ